jgi:hypothetical protein
MRASNYEKEVRQMLRKDPASVYCLISGAALLVLGVTGVFLPGQWGILQFDPAHNVYHLVAGGFALYAALLADDKWLATLYAQSSGAVYVLLAIAGYFSPTLWGIGGAMGVHLELAEDIFHLLVGGWGLYAGFAQSLLPGVCGRCRA